MSLNHSYINNRNISYNSNLNNYSYNTNNKTTTITVAIRLRPLLPHEDFEYWIIDPQNNLITSSLEINHNYSFYKKDKNNNLNTINQLLLDNIYIPQSFKFDKIFTKEITSEKIYLDICQDIIKGFLKGINGTIFTYGQTTSGKTYTMLGNVNYPGILPCSLKNVFDLLELQKKEKNLNYNLYCSYIEIYNEIIHDLIGDATGCKIIEDNNYGLIVSEAQKICITSFEEGVQLKDIGEEKRIYKNTIINEYSSRSHTIFQLFLETSTIDNDNNTVYNKYSLLNLVDLAGSERVNKDENNNNSSETGYINKSLFALANVIKKLSENKNIHIPYRDSKLTRLLSVALGGGSLVTIICNISPSASNYFQTVSTLRFASRAKNIKIKPEINEKIIKKFKEKQKLLENNNYNNYKNSIINYGYNAFNNNNNIYNILEENENDNEIENSNNSKQNDFQTKYYELLLKNKKLKAENDKLKISIDNLMELNKNVKNNNNSEESFIDKCIDKIKSLILKTNNNKDINQYINNNLKELKINYINQLKSLQNIYLSKINELQNAFMASIPNDFNTSNNEENDEIINEEKNIELFSEIDLNFGDINDIQNVKIMYENKENQLEQLMKKYKENTNLYFDNLLKNNVDKNNIKLIYAEHKEKMSELEKLYKNAQNKLEKNFFDKLREITNFNRQNNY